MLPSSPLSREPIKPFTIIIEATRCLRFHCSPVETIKEAFAHVSIIANGRNWNIKIIRACCPEFLELAKKAVYPLAE